MITSSRRRTLSASPWRGSKDSQDRQPQIGCPSLGASPQAGAWFNVFAVLGEYFYHSNLRTPRWMGYFLQRPEHHSIHHQLDVHQFNYRDITWWDRIFGTFQDAEDFAPQCGFPDEHEKNLGRMLAFRDNY